jgi:hypothetical protein
MRRGPLALVVLGLLGAPGPLARAQVPEMFVTSERCLACHNGLVTPKGEDVSIGVSWRASMMANSARDPYWQAAVRRETLVHPTASAAIQNECAACHMPMARHQANAEGRLGEVFAHLPIVRSAEDEDQLAADGVSCAVCHQIGEERLGERESFNAGFVVDKTTPAGERLAFGPYEIDAGRQTLMRSASTYVPEQSVHIQRSEMCATCHTLITHTLDADGQVVGELPEQVPYLEWLHSDYRGKKSCQDCHMLEVDGEMKVSSVVGLPREQVSRHVFLGGNLLMPLILSRHASELGVIALPQELQTASRRTRQNLETASARLAVEDGRIEDGTLTAEVVVTNLAGHKLPTAYPSRRAWLHVVVRNGGGNVVFETGRPEDDGSIAGNDNDADPTRFEPHYEVIRRADEVQIYEPILADPKGAVTTVLLSALTYAKDNRLLPTGFDKATAEEAVAVHGRARDDRDFVAGRDRVTYVVELGAATGPFSVEATLWYQPISYRWAHNVNDRESPEGTRFVGYYREMAGVSAHALARVRAPVR